MEAYSSFAEVYDLFMDNVPYEEWCVYITGLLKEYGIEDGLLLELGCGTGKLTRLLQKAGFDMIGVDNSEEMLEIAKQSECEETEDHEAAFDGEETIGIARQSEYEETEDHEAAFDGEETIGIARQSECEETEDHGEAFDGEELQEDGMCGGAAEELPGEEPGENAAILYLLQDMREFELYGTVRAVVSICDSMNYILQEEELLQVFRLVNNYLDPGGIFIFDLNTLYKYRELLGENTISENREEGSFIWENYFEEDSGINEYDLTLFIRQEGDLYRRYRETHYQRAYELGTVKTLLEEAGMEFVTAYDAFTREPVREDSERIYVIAREQGKTKCQRSRMEEKDE